MCNIKDDYSYYTNIFNDAIMEAEKADHPYDERRIYLLGLLNGMVMWAPEYFIKNSLDVHFSGEQGIIFGDRFVFSFCVYRKKKYKVYCYVAITPGLIYDIVKITEIYMYGFRENLRTHSINKSVSPEDKIRILNKILEKDYTL